MKELVEIWPGAQLDDMVAERVFGYRVRHGTTVYDGRMMPCTLWIDPSLPDERRYHMNPRPYSTDFVAAWDVVKKMIQDGWLAEISVRRNPQYSVDFRRWHESVQYYVGATWVGYKLPEAICKAAIKARVLGYSDANDAV